MSAIEQAKNSYNEADTASAVRTFIDYSIEPTAEELSELEGLVRDALRGWNDALKASLPEEARKLVRFAPSPELVARSAAGLRRAALVQLRYRLKNNG